MKENSEYDLFLELWAERPHVSELSGKPLKYAPGHKLFTWQFLHVIAKGISPKSRLMKDNIMLATPEEHTKQDQYEPFLKRKVELLKKLYNKK